METFLVFLLMTVAFGGILMILAFGYRSIEAERARKGEGATTTPDLAQVPRFFAHLESNETAAPREAIDESAVRRFEEYIRNEQSLAADFVSEPTVERLYRGSVRVN